MATAKATKGRPKARTTTAQRGATPPTGALYFTTLCAFPNDGVVVGGHFLSQDTEPTGTRLMTIQRGSWAHTKAILEHRGLGARAPPLAPARGAEFDWAG